MQFPESWLRAFCDPELSSQALADTLTMAGLEVEEMRPAAPSFSGVVVASIEQVDPHPDADRLRVCRVDAGQGEPLQIVCGAPNARVGIKVPCALVGAQLPVGADGAPGLRIKRGKLRGVESLGMLCSAQELGLDDDASGLHELAADAPVGQDLRQHLLLDDAIFTLKLTPNLAHCLSVYGIARELSALTGAPLKTPALPTLPASHDEVLPVRVQASDLCGRFSGRVVRGIDPQAPTPAWMVQRLARCGQRSISALVDISNYVMFEYGRPSHIFDRDRIQGGLEVRWGRAGETLKLLNGNTVEVDGQVGVVADEGGVESLAGIMGGDHTAVSDSTRNVYVEAAFWWPRAIAGRSRRYNFSTDAGHRFERGVDPALTAAHVDYISALIVDICGGQVGPIDDHQARMPQPAAVQLRVARAQRVLGMSLNQAQCAQALRGLGLDVTEGPGTVTVQPPSYRFDLQIEEDLIEEVARVLGYAQLPDTPPRAPVVATRRPEARRGPFALRRQLAQLGYQETINYSFVDERWERDWADNTDPIRLLNPIASQMGVMRSSLLGGLLGVLQFNVDRKADQVRVFEIGRVFRKNAQVPDSDTTVAGFDQPMRVAGLLYGDAQPLQWASARRGVDFYDIKADVEALLAPRQAVFEPAEHSALHPGRCARVRLDGEVIGHLGELHPRWRQALGLQQPPVLFELDLAAVQQGVLPVARPVSRLQAVERDLAVVVSEGVAHDAVVAAARSADTQGWLRDVRLFDIYRPRAEDVEAGRGRGLQSGEKSLALRLSLERDDATLTDEQIEQAVQAVLQALQRDVAARLRA